MHLQKFFFVFLISFLSALNCNYFHDEEIKKKQSDVINFARTYGETISPRGWEDEYWDNVASFTDIKSCNEAMNLNRDKAHRYSLTEDYWFWRTDSLRLVFETMRNDLK